MGKKKRQRKRQNRISIKSIITAVFIVLLTVAAVWEYIVPTVRERITSIKIPIEYWNVLIIVIAIVLLLYALIRAEGIRAWIKNKFTETVNRNLYKPIDKMGIEEIADGYKFELYIANILIKNNYSNVTVTPQSGDYGVDVLAEKDGIKYAIQCKYYSNPVGVEAVQEASAGKAFYNAHVSIVATNNVFTANARELAGKIGVVLWDRDIINKMN